MPVRKRLDRHEWAAAALDALAAGGLAAVAVEPIAARLGATKGSFYHHFRNRDALVDAALELWELRNTDAVIAATGDPADARAALRNLLGTVLGSVTAEPGDLARGHAVEMALQADGRHPAVAAALERVSHRRIEHLTALFADLGLAPDEAAHRALLAFTAYLGHVQLARATPDLLPRGAALDAYLDGMLAALTGAPRTP
ncbi:TetR/AcrR family transcriptional regulator [Pseudonocardia endophytica]|uniref:TetR/AcrR family transcriptional regulator n=1 Tax=Pseudonocardia endophytica TaxID=401976 RepID=UPI001FB5410D|nr:TetR/AcrR family transcriptional regulator [Pseudonocardia endophytica]